MERRGNTDGTVSLRLAEYRQDLQEFPLFPPPVEKAGLPKKDAGLEMVFPLFCSLSLAFLVFRYPTNRGSFVRPREVVSSNCVR